VSQRLDNLLGALVVALSDTMSSAVAEAAGHPGALSAALAVLAQEPGLSIEQLRLPLGRTQSATVRLVDQLAADGYAERRPGHDRRSVSVVLTEKGSEAAARVLDRRRQVLHDATASLDASERKALTAALEKVLAAITTDRVHADQICRLCDLAVCPEPACPVEQAATKPHPDGWPTARPVPSRFRTGEGRQ